MRKSHATQVLGLLVALALGCSGKAPAHDESNAGRAGSGQSDGSGDDDDPANPGGGASSPGGPSSSSNGGGGGSGGIPEDPTELLPGIGAPLDVPPSGCIRGVASGKLTLSLSAAIPSVELRERDGLLLANGSACSRSDGEPVALSDITFIDVTGTPGNDAVILDLGEGDWSSVLALEEHVVLRLGTGRNAVLVRGTPGDDTFLHGLRGAQLVLGLLGNDRIHLVADGVTELGASLGAGDDRFDDMAAFLQATGGPPSGTLAITMPVIAVGAAGSDLLRGGAGDDLFDGGAGDDVMNGFGGNDVFLAGDEADGADILNGGADYDEVSYELRSNDLDIQLCRIESHLGCGEGPCACSAPSGESGEDDWILNVESVILGSGNDTARGTDASESFSGGAGDDALYGLAGSDLLNGELGIDHLEGGTDGDICDGKPDETMIECEL